MRHEHADIGDSQLAAKQCMDSLKLSVQQLLLLATGNPARRRLRGKAAEKNESSSSSSEFSTPIPSSSSSSDSISLSSIPASSSSMSCNCVCSALPDAAMLERLSAW
ncbi:hypothetical protein INR49_006232 [Caranx melampygus]|nr:hypothetical protein INR49_006232 [Caranx melampygus]